MKSCYTAAVLNEVSLPYMQKIYSIHEGQTLYIFIYIFKFMSIQRSSVHMAAQTALWKSPDINAS